MNKIKKKKIYNRLNLPSNFFKASSASSYFENSLRKLIMYKKYKNQKKNNKPQMHKYFCIAYLQQFQIIK